MTSRQEKEVELYRVLEDHIPKAKINQKNSQRAWKTGYDPDYDVVIISKDGTIGEIYRIQDKLNVALPKVGDEVYKRSSKKSEQYWEREELPEELKKIKTIFQWNEKPKEFKAKWISYIEREFDRRENGFWFKNNGIDTWMPPSHYMYCQWSKIDVGYPDYREANRIFWIYWEACKVDNRCYGMDYLKIRRSGFSFMAASDEVNTATLAKESHLGILSKTGGDAKSLFTNKIVRMNSNYPFFFKPIMDGMEKPKTELVYRVPSKRITKKNMYDIDFDDHIEGLNTVIDWRNTDDNSYDGEKLLRLVHDESGKWIKPNNILNNWRVTKTCLRLGAKITGKCLMGSTCNAQSKGGAEYKKLYYASDPNKRDNNGQTQSGLYSLFIPMEWNMEGFIDRYGFPVFRKPSKPVIGVDGEKITNGAIDYWEAEVEGLKSDPDALNEFYRQYPRTEAHAFRDESKNSLFNLTKIYQQIDFNDASDVHTYNLTRGSFRWKDGIRDTKVIFEPNKNGRFLVSWIPKESMQNNVIIKNGRKYPGNEHIGAFGCDSYDISGTVDGRGSNGALHGLTTMHMDSAPSNEFFLEYVARPQTAEIFFEDVLMAIVFYGMPILAENNKPRLLYHLKNRGYRGFSLTRPDKSYNKLSPTEKELGGIPNTSQDVKQAHAAAIEMYIEKYVGFDMEGKYRPSDQIGSMYFNKTLENWARFDINNRTMFDAAISSGLAIMACNRHLYKPQVQESKVIVNFARYDNSGRVSEIIT